MLQVITDPRVEDVYANYPDFVRDKMLYLRALVIDTAKAMQDVTILEETLKWGEPSFLTKKGSTLRMDWKQQTPNQYALYFQCSTRLVDTFKLVFSQKFSYQGKRAIVFKLNETLPELELQQCIQAALRYHNVKNQVTLGI